MSDGTDPAERPPAEPIHEAGGQPVDDELAPITRARLEVPGRVFAQAAIVVLITLAVIRFFAQVLGGLILITLSLILAAALVPMVDWLERHRVPRGIAALIAIAGVVLIILILLGLVIPPLIIQGIELANILPDLLDNWQSSLKKYPDIDDSLQKIIDKIRGDPAALFTGILRFGLGAATAVFGGVLLLTITLYFLIDRVRIRGAVIRQVSAPYRAQADLTIKGVASICRAYFVGQLVVSGLFAIVTYILLTILGAPFAAILAALAFFLDAIPNIGSLIAIILAFLLGLTQSLTAGIIAAAVLIVYNQIENYLISPKILSGRLKVPPVFTMIAVLLGGALFGILGIIIAIPLVGSIPVLERIWFPHGIGNR